MKHNILDLSTKLIRQISHRKEIESWRTVANLPYQLS